MFETLEIRWFWPCPASDSIFNWFLGGTQEPDQEERTDIYLLLPGCRTVGVKLRENRFEIKALIEEYASFGRLPGPDGTVQRWTKWSLASENLPAMIEDILGTGTWQKIHKQRFKRRWNFRSGHFPAQPANTSEPDNGCSVELTRLHLPPNRPTWMTLAFEAFGPSSDLVPLLEAGVAAFWREKGEPPAVGLSAAISCGYAGWLTNRPQEAAETWPGLS